MDCTSFLKKYSFLICSDFGHSLDNMSHIEGIWAYLKKIIASMNVIIPNKNLILYLRENEFRRNINL